MDRVNGIMILIVNIINIIIINYYNNSLGYMFLKKRERFERKRSFDFLIGFSNI